MIESRLSLAVQCFAGLILVLLIVIVVPLLEEAPK